MRILTRLLLIFSPLFSAAWTGSAISQTIDEIALLQNSRSVADGRLYRFLSSRDSDQRARAAVAFANIQDSASIPNILPLLSDPVPLVRRNSAYALGQIGNVRSAIPLLARLHIESDRECLEESIEALGKCGSREELRMLVSTAISLPVSVQRPIVISVARFANRKVKDSIATDYAASLIGDLTSAPWATYAFMRIADSASVVRHLPALLRDMNDPSPEVRMWTATILGNIADTATAKPLMAHALDDPDWRVKVNSVRSLEELPSQLTLQLLVRLIAGADEHVALAAYSVLESRTEKYPADSLVAASVRALDEPTRYSWQRRGEAAMLLAKILKGNSVPQIISQFDSSALFRAKLIEALGETKSAVTIPILKKELLSGQRQSVAAAIEAYRTIVMGGDSAVQAEFCQDIVPLLHRRDFTTSVSVVIAFEDTSIRKSLRKKYLPELISFFKSLSSPGDDDIGVELINVFADLRGDSVLSLLERTVNASDQTLAGAAVHALRAMTGKKYEAQLARSFPTKSFYRQEDLSLLQRIHSTVLTTTRGKIKIELRPDAAPFTVLNFILLAKKHFYDHLLFHRVVPNFVIQGGDPQGTGFGGPGYAIKTETCPGVYFSAGAVGMASSGRDTEGSQFFITHCPTPHLDGRYSLFGYTKDLDVVNKMQVGDEILSVELSE